MNVYKVGSQVIVYTLIYALVALPSAVTIFTKDFKQTIICLILPAISNFILQIVLAVFH